MWHFASTPHYQATKTAPSTAYTTGASQLPQKTLAGENCVWYLTPASAAAKAQASSQKSWCFSCEAHVRLYVVGAAAGVCS
jgi:hypothetical protein